MNVHDSERLSGLLEQAGYQAPADGEQADVVVFNTCAVRENADNKLYGNLGHLASVKAKHPGMQIAVGGCLAQKDRAEILRRAPWVDVVFGTHNVGSLPTLLERARHNDEAQLEILDSLEVFPSSLPAKRDSHYAGWVSISVGCNNTCTFCIVPVAARQGGRPATRRHSRRSPDAGRRRRSRGHPAGPERQLLRSAVRRPGRVRQAAAGDCGAVEGLERVRFTSPHPKDFTPDVIEAMAETANVCHQLHMPLQSGSDRVLRAMRRSYRSERYLSILSQVRESMPDAAITTDIIVGFPGETEEDFQATLDVVAESRFAAAFTFQYSPRPGTPAATMPDQVPREVVTERFQRLMAVVDASALAGNQGLLGSTVEVLVANGEGRKDQGQGRLSGRARDGRLVHFTPVGAIDRSIRPGDVVTTAVSYAAPHHLMADGGVLSPPADQGRRPVRGGHGADHARGRVGHAEPRAAGPHGGAGLGLHGLLTSGPAGGDPAWRCTGQRVQVTSHRSARSRERITAAAFRASDPVNARLRASAGVRPYRMCRATSRSIRSDSGTSRNQTSVS